MFFNFKNPFDVLSEACKSECGDPECEKKHDEDEYEDHEEHDDDMELEEAATEKEKAEKELEDELEDTEEMDGEVELTAEMVNLFYDGARYYIEGDDLAKVMDSEDTEDPEEALDKVKAANELEESAEIAVMIESREAIASYVAEAKAAKKGGKKDAMGKVEDSAEFLKNVKNKGIKVVTKKSKKK